MTLEDTLQTEGCRSVDFVTWRSFTHLPTGLGASGDFEVLDVVDPRMDLGSDTRESGRLHLIRADNANLLALIKQEDRFQLNSDSSTWQFTRRDDNPGDVRAKLFLVKVAIGDS